MCSNVCIPILVDWILAAVCILPFYDPYDVTPHISFLGRLRVMDHCSIVTSGSPILSSLTFVRAQQTISAHGHGGLFAHKILRPAPIVLLRAHLSASLLTSDFITVPRDASLAPELIT
jgi:hypothetical protein